MFNADVRAPAIDPVMPTTLYAGIDGDGVFKRMNGGSWNAVNTGLSNTHVRALAIDPITPTLLYAGTAGGVFKSTNGGGNWSAANTGLTNTDVDTLAIDPATPATLYAGTPGGAFKSTNGGGNWSAVNTGLSNTNVRALAIDPATPATLYAGTPGGVFKSTDGGGSWSVFNTGLTNTDVRALAIDPATPTTLYAGTPGGVFAIQQVDEKHRIYLPLVSVHVPIATDTISFTRITTGAIVNDTTGTSSGACWGDYDDDGYLDLFVANWGGEDNFLYHNNRDGTFEKITSGAIVNDGGWSRGCTWGDYDNDGFLDLFVSNDGGGNFLYHNEGGTSFTRVFTGPIAQDGGNCYGVAWVDYDDDGWLDLFVARHTNADNLLYHNLGNGTFERISEGDIVHDGGYSISVSWGDYDDDGCVDLFVANVNDQDNLLYHNNCDGTFTKITDSPITTDGGVSPSSNWVDYDNDQDLDLFVANWDEDNFLYRNNGDGTFTKILTSVIVTEGDVHDSSWADLDNDGDMDLYMGAYDVNHRLYQNNGDEIFVPVSGVPVVEDSSSEIGIWGDYDNDGDLDLFVTSPGLGKNSLYRNEGTENHWINIRLIGTVSNWSAIGARVTVVATINGVLVSQIREVSGSTGGIGQDSLNVEFGLGDAAIIDSIVIEWPSGIVQVLGNITVDQFMTIREPSHRIFLPFVVRNPEP